MTARDIRAEDLRVDWVDHVTSPWAVVDRVTGRVLLRYRTHKGATAFVRRAVAKGLTWTRTGEDGVH